MQPSHELAPRQPKATSSNFWLNRCQTQRPVIPAPIPTYFQTTSTGRSRSLYPCPYNDEHLSKDASAALEHYQCCPTRMWLEGMLLKYCLLGHDPEKLFEQWVKQQDEDRPRQIDHFVGYSPGAYDYPSPPLSSNDTPCLPRTPPTDLEIPGADFTGSVALQSLHRAHRLTMELESSENVESHSEGVTPEQIRPLDLYKPRGKDQNKDERETIPPPTGILTQVGDRKLRTSNKKRRIQFSPEVSGGE